MLRVADDGPGIPAELPPRCSSGSPAATAPARRASGSTGLGLSIVAAVVHAHGGQVACPPAAVGAVFEVRLPLAGPAGTSAAGAPDDLAVPTVRPA